MTQQLIDPPTSWQEMQEAANEEPNYRERDNTRLVKRMGHPHAWRVAHFECVPPMPENEHEWVEFDGQNYTLTYASPRLLTQAIATVWRGPNKSELVTIMRCNRIPDAEDLIAESEFQYYWQAFRK